MTRLRDPSGPSAASRRAFLKGSAASAAAFVLGVHVPFGREAQAAGPLAPGIFDPNVFLRIGLDNTVTILSKHFEMGQGVVTGLATLIAEELEADWAQMRYAFAPNNPARYNNLAFGPFMATGGTTSIFNSWEQMRKVGAAARMMLISAAAARWNVGATDITAEKGRLYHRRSQRDATFGDLAEAAMKQAVPAHVTLKSPKDWRLIGQRVPRLDSIEKTTGKSTFAADVRRPGELVAMIKRPELFGATVQSFDAVEARKLPGVVDVVEVPSGIAVLAKDTWSAMRGREALRVAWDTSKAERRSTSEILDEYRRLAGEPGLSAARRGDAMTALAKASQVVEAEFSFPYLAHAPMEPLNAVLELRQDGAEIWSGCQLQSIDAFAAARVLGLKPDQIRINTLLGGGSFGRRGNPFADWTLELASIAKATNGRAPVHLVWTREDDIKGGYYRPLALHRVKAGLDASGRISGWQHKVVCQSIFTGSPWERSAVKDGVDRGSVEGLVDSPYEISDLSVEAYNARSPVPVLWWRSVGHSHTAHAVETMIDELARRSMQDPLAFRRNLLGSHPRDLGVLNLAAEKAGWGGTLPGGRGRGIACHQSYNTFVAMVAEVTVGKGQYAVDRIVCAVDCGVPVNPDIIEAQVQGAVGFALSTVLRNQVTLAAGAVEQGNFDDFEPTRISEMPKVEVHIVPSREPPTGIGEPGVPPLAPAIGNAIAAATGKRLYSLPFDRRVLG